MKTAEKRAAEPVKHDRVFLLSLDQFHTDFPRPITKDLVPPSPNGVMQIAIILTNFLIQVLQKFLTEKTPKEKTPNLSAFLHFSPISNSDMEKMDNPVTFFKCRLI